MRGRVLVILKNVEDTNRDTIHKLVFKKMKPFREEFDYYKYYTTLKKLKQSCKENNKSKWRESFKLYKRIIKNNSDYKLIGTKIYTTVNCNSQFDYYEYINEGYKDLYYFTDKNNKQVNELYKKDLFAITGSDITDVLIDKEWIDIDMKKDKFNDILNSIDANDYLIVLSYHF